MALECRSGHFSTGTGAIASTVEVNFSSAMAAAPTLVIFSFNGRTDTTDAVGRATHKRGIGLAASASDRRMISNMSEDGVAAANTLTRLVATECISILLTTGSVDGAFDLTSMDSDGFTLDVTNQFASSYDIQYWAIAGTTNVETFGITASLATGNVDYTLSGAFQPDVVFLIAAQTTSAATTTVADDMFMVGAASGASNQCVFVGGSNNAATTIDANSHARGGEIVAITASNIASIVARATFVQFNSNGFRLNWSEVSGNAHQIYGVAIKGGVWNVGESLTQTDTVTAITVSGVGFTPVGGMIFSSCAAEDASDTLHANDRYTFGMFDSASSRRAIGTLDEDNVADSEVSTASEFDAVYANISTASAIQGLMDIQSMDSDGVTFIMDDADPSQSFFAYILCGNVAASTGQGLLIAQQRNHMIKV